MKNLILILITLICFSCNNNTVVIQKKYCIIDSISISNQYEVTPEIIYVYKTNCNIIVTSKKMYDYGDSIQLNILK